MLRLLVGFCALLLGGVLVMQAYDLVVAGIDTYCLATVDASCSATRMTVLVGSLVVVGVILLVAGMLIERQRQAERDKLSRMAPKPSGYSVAMVWHYAWFAGMWLSVLAGFWVALVFIEAMPGEQGHRSFWLVIGWILVGAVAGFVPVLVFGLAGNTDRVKPFWDARRWPYDAWKAYGSTLSSNQLDVVVEAGPVEGNAAAAELESQGLVGEALQAQLSAPTASSGSWMAAYMAGLAAGRRGEDADVSGPDEYRWSTDQEPEP